MFKYNKIIDKKLNNKESLFCKKEIFEKLILLNDVWSSKKEQEAIRLFSTDFEIKIKKIKIKYFLITRPYAGYDLKKKHIYISMYTKNLSSTITHELHHLFFIINFDLILKQRYKLTEKQVGEFKEIMIFMINKSEYKNIVPQKDSTYKDIVPVQSKMLKIWNKRKNFSDFLDKAIKLYIKTYYFSDLK